MWSDPLELKSRSLVNLFVCSFTLAMVLGTSSPVLARNSPPGFVGTSGIGFVLDGQTFAFQGTNAVRFGTMAAESEERIYQAMRDYAYRGLKVIRFWGFSCSGYLGQSMPIIESASPYRISYNEMAFQRLDATLDAARAAGLKVILPLVNFEPSYCGMEWWTQQVSGNSDKHVFYTDQRVKTAFKLHINNLLNRVNTRYQKSLGKSVRYKDDPTIMAIELANEPHTEDYYEQNRGWPAGELVYNFLLEFSAYVRSIDSSHLISSGEEGYKTSIDPQYDSYRHSWINDGSKGVNFEKNVRISTLDFATVHIYPDNWNIPSNQMDWVETYLLKRRADIAHAAGKPIVLEESGFNSDPNWNGWHLGYGSSPAWYLARIYELANRYGYAGTLIWQLMPPGFLTGGYDYDFNHPVSQVITRQAEFMNRLKMIGGESGPDYAVCSSGGNTDPDGDGWGWENGASCRVL